MASPDSSTDTRFQPGQSGNPKGRPKGSRNKLSEQFLSDLQEDWEENGKATLAKVREERPQDYLRAVVMVLPKELHVKSDPLEEMTDMDLAEKIEGLASELGFELIPAAGSGPH